MPLEVLYFAFVLFGCLASGKSAQILPFVGSGIFLSRVETIFTGFEFANHTETGSNRLANGQYGSLSSLYPFLVETHVLDGFSFRREVAVRDVDGAAPRLDDRRGGILIGGAARGHP